MENFKTKVAKFFQVSRPLIYSFIATYVLFILGAFDWLELKFYDLRIALKHTKPSEKVVIVAIDQESYDALLEKFPWTRRYYAHLIRNLRRAGAKLIVFDVEFDLPHEDREGDSVFAVAMQGGNDVILAAHIVEEKGRTAQSRLVTPYPLFEHACRSLALVNIFLDRDGFVRYYPVKFTYRDKKFYSLACQAAVLLGINIDSILGNKREFLINYVGEAGTIPTYSLWTVLDDEEFEIPTFDIDAFNELLIDEVFKDKVVFVGATLEEFHDFCYTPFYRFSQKHALMPGVEVHANALETILQGNFIRTTSYLGIIGLLFLGVLLTQIIIYLFKVQFKKIVPVLVTLAFGYLYLSVKIFEKYNFWLYAIGPVGAVFITFIINVNINYLKEQREKRFIKNIFQHYLSETLVEELIRHPDMLKLGGERKYLTVLFSDVAGFTTISEGLSPEELVAILNEYLSRMTEIILKYDGMLDKYEGDAIMAVFGAPIPREEHAKLACRAAIDMQKELERLHKEWEGTARPKLFTRIGINTGEMVIGNMGSARRMDYTVIGDNVNLASRLEGANKMYGTKIMISEETCKHVENEILVRELDIIRVKGKKLPVKVYEVIGYIHDKNISSEFYEFLNKYLMALKLYQLRKWERALEIFKEALKLHPEDKPTKIYIERCNHYIKNPPPDDWDGVFELKEK